MITIEDKLRPSMVDPSIFTSDKHLTFLIKYHSTETFLSRIYIPYTFVRLVKEEGDNETLETLRYFVFPMQKYRVKLSKDWQKLKHEILKMPFYEAKTEYEQEILPILEEQFESYPPFVKDILIEEYSFMREHSSLLLKGKQAIRYFQKILPVTIDATNRLVDKKQKLFHETRGLRWTIAFLLAIRDLPNLPKARALT